ncbi:DegT/DnrJ/EryC1/StrS family aminotransferase [Amylibacter sp.]|nr:DegT/DnrJ/EryC1/StrS family aminotransferase [Amylibacter sp.]
MIPLFKVNMPVGFESELIKTMNSGYIGEGPKVAEFELGLSEFIGNQYPLTVNSGTSGLHLALRLSDVGFGDEVITTPMTCTATNMPIIERGAKIVWSDIDPLTGSICPRSIEKNITDKTKAIMVVHWGGNVVDLHAIHKIAKKHKIKVIEDAAHAFGSTLNSKKIGNHSDFVVFSFQAIKHLTTIDGGAVFCANEADWERGKRLKWFGIDRNQSRKDFRCEEDIIEHGYKFHMNDVCATIGLHQLNHIASVINKHNKNWAFYNSKIKETSKIRKIPIIENSTTSAWLYTIHVESRDEFVRHMSDNGIVVSRVHERNDTHSCFVDSKVKLPGTDIFNSTQVSIPVGWWLTEKDKETIIQSVNSY